ncbi:MAG TPA: nickel pincer cofactor biosynthesis protein LarB [Thermoplasmata archaeon]|nr:nickel pincer cofactor biosynthesis protein LarB [Thermoplasmata archaeon]
MASTHRRRGRSGAGRELPVDEYARFDLGRPERTGIPEVILAEGKAPDQVLGILAALARAGRGAFVSRVGPALEQRLTGWRPPRAALTFDARARVAILSGPLADGVRREGLVAILTAGTADVPVAEEARLLLEAAGARVETRYDVGVAGLHRLHRALEQLVPLRPRLYLVFAGREGALPTVVAGLVRAPVIGVPTSQGYGRGGKGEAALGAMLQSCAALAVVNIDGAVPAALFALQLLAHGTDRPRVRARSLRRGPRRGTPSPSRTL